MLSRASVVSGLIAETHRQSALNYATLSFRWPLCRLNSNAGEHPPMRQRANYLHWATTLLTILGMGATAMACDLPEGGAKIDRSEELRDYFYLWVELELDGEAGNERARVVGALDDAGAALQDCDPSHELSVLNQRLLVMRAWVRRAQRRADRTER